MHAPSIDRARMVYLAAPFSRYHEVVNIRTKLRALGFKCDPSWLRAAEQLHGVDTADPPDARKAYQDNARDILLADVVLVLVYAGEGQMAFCEAQYAHEKRVPHHWLRMHGCRKLPLLAHAFGDVHETLEAAVRAFRMAGA